MDYQQSLHLFTLMLLIKLETGLVWLQHHLPLITHHLITHHLSLKNPQNKPNFVWQLNPVNFSFLKTQKTHLLQDPLTVHLAEAQYGYQHSFSLFSFHMPFLLSLYLQPFSSPLKPQSQKTTQASTPPSMPTCPASMSPYHGIILLPHP